eukprot:SAG31_NODE_1558_length_7885_cov_2.567300_8_plen_112_part_00
MEKELFVDMQDDILEKAALLYSLSDLASNVDCLIALALAAENYKLCRPDIIDSGATVVVRGRHLLQELCVDVFIPNDANVGPGTGCVKVITGTTEQCYRAASFGLITCLRP